MTVSDQQVKNSFLSIGVRRVTLACFLVGSSRVLSDRFLSTGVRPVRLALLRAGRSRLTCGRPCRLVSGPFLWAGSRPGAHAEALRFTPTRQGEHTVTLVLAHDRSKWKYRARTRCSGQETANKSLHQPARGRTS